MSHTTTPDSWSRRPQQQQQQQSSSSSGAAAPLGPVQFPVASLRSRSTPITRCPPPQPVCAVALAPAKSKMPPTLLAPSQPFQGKPKVQSHFRRLQSADSCVTGPSRPPVHQHRLQKLPHPSPLPILLSRTGKVNRGTRIPSTILVAHTGFRCPAVCSRRRSVQGGLC
jgi:hypothetical protein